MTSETLFGDTGTTDVDAALSNGLLAPGDSGSLSTSYDGSVTDPDDHTTTVTFNWMSHPTGEDEANGGTPSTTYGSGGFPVAVTDALGRTDTYTYDSEGDVTSITEPYVGEFMGTMVYSRTETINYDEYGVPTSVTDFDGKTTTFMLDDNGNVLEEEQPGGIDEEWTYNSAGQVLTDTDGNGATTTYTYNDLGQLTEIQEPGAGSPTIEYGFRGHHTRRGVWVPGTPGFRGSGDTIPGVPGTPGFRGQGSEGSGFRDRVPGTPYPIPRGSGDTIPNSGWFRVPGTPYQFGVPGTPYPIRVPGTPYPTVPGFRGHHTQFGSGSGGSGDTIPNSFRGSGDTIPGSGDTIRNSGGSGDTIRNSGFRGHHTRAPWQGVRSSVGANPTRHLGRSSR